MAIEFTELTEGQATNSAQTHDTASIAPDANALIIAVVYVRTNTVTGAPSLSGCGLTWQLISGGGAYNVSIYRAVGTPSPGVVTIDYPGTETCAAVIWGIYQFTSTEIGNNGADAIQQVKTGNTGTTVRTLTAFTAWQSGSAGLVAFGTPGTYPSTPASGWTETTDRAISGSASLAVHYKIGDPSGTPAANYGASNPSSCDARGIEILAAVPTIHFMAGIGFGDFDTTIP